MLLANCSYTGASVANGDRRVAIRGLSSHQAIKRTTFVATAPPRSKARRFWPSGAGRAAIGLPAHTSHTEITLPGSVGKSAHLTPDSLTSHTSSTLQGAE